MKASKLEAEYSTSIEKDLWEKFIFLVGMSGATASTRMPLGPIREDPNTLALLQGLMQEVEAVGIKKGIPLQGLAEKSLAFAKGAPPAVKASMLEDLERGNRLETDWLQGKVVELGSKLGVPTPVNRDVYAVLKLHGWGRRPKITPVLEALAGKPPIRGPAFRYPRRDGGLRVARNKIRISDFESRAVSLGRK